MKTREMIVVAHGYTIEDMCAISDARCCSYGVVQQHLELGAPWPPLRKSVRWPKDSNHKGEMQLDAKGREFTALQLPDAPDQKEHPKPRTRKQIVNYPPCTACGEATDASLITHVVTHVGRCRKHTSKVIGNYCPSCFAKLMPWERPTKADMRPAKDDDGKKLDTRNTARCSRCRCFYSKAAGAAIYIDNATTTHKKLGGYLCPECLAAWNTKKSPAP